MRIPSRSRLFAIPLFEQRRPELKSMQSIQTAPPLTASYGLTKFRARMRRIFFRLILIVLGVGVGLGLSEIVMRAFQLGHTRNVILYKDKIYKLPPHASFMNLYHAFGKEVLRRWSEN